MGMARVQMLGSLEEPKILVIIEDSERVSCSLEPLIQHLLDSQKLLVADIIISFRGCQFLGAEDIRTKLGSFNETL